MLTADFQKLFGDENLHTKMSRLQQVLNGKCLKLTNQVNGIKFRPVERELAAISRIKKCSETFQALVLSAIVYLVGEGSFYYKLELKNKIGNK